MPSAARSGSPPWMSLQQALFTFCSITIPAAFLAIKYVLAKKSEISNEMLFSVEALKESRSAEAGNEYESVEALPWPQNLPGRTEIDIYNNLKAQVLLRGSDGSKLVNGEARLRLRHALMDRCQAHVAWLLRLEREQGLIERMARRGVMSEDDYERFSLFAELLDMEVSKVREEASWLCEVPEQSRQASEEIW